MRLDTERKHQSVLFVCMGNICRSPTAEGVLRELLATEAPELDVDVDSAGTHAYHVGEPPDPRAIAAAERRGVDLTRLRARHIEAADLTRFDYILVMDEQNLAAIRALRPCGAGTHVGLLLDYFPAAGRREVPDPYLHGPAAFDQVFELIDGAARGFLGVLRESAAAK